MSLVTAEIRAAASEMYQGDEICREKSQFLLTEMGLPNGLLPLKDIVEVGYVKDTGFVWLIQKKKCEHRFEKIGKPVQYATEVTAYVEPNRIYKLTGVKAKELLLWVMLKEIYVDVPPSGKITFKTPTGLFRTFPVDAFLLEEEVKPTAVLLLLLLLLPLLLQLPLRPLLKSRRRSSPLLLMLKSRKRSSPVLLLLRPLLFSVRFEGSNLVFLFFKMWESAVATLMHLVSVQVVS